MLTVIIYYDYLLICNSDIRLNGMEFIVQQFQQKSLKQIEFN